MTTASLLSQGMTLLTYGMGTVFVFLTLLVIATTLMSKVIAKFVPEPVEPPVSTGATTTTGGAVNGRTLAIIKAAIDQHRAK